MFAFQKHVHVVCYLHTRAHDIAYIYVNFLLINAHTDVSNTVRGENVGLGLYLHPYYVYASSEGSGVYNSSATSTTILLEGGGLRKCLSLNSAVLEIV